MADHFLDATKKADCISLETAITHIKENQCKGCSDIGLCGNCAVLIALKLLKNVPAADVRPVVMGEWLMPNADKTDRPMPECSVCGWYVTEEAAMEFTFCPTCGADMITGKEENGRT